MVGQWWVGAVITNRAFVRYASSSGDWQDSGN